MTDELMDAPQVELLCAEMRDALVLDEAAFAERYPYDGTDYMTYFGSKPPKYSIRSITKLSAEKKKALYEQGKTMIDQLDATDLALLASGDGTASTASRCVELWQTAEEVLDKPSLVNELLQLEYPLYFYDYETVSWPVPLLQGTSPRQQVVVQYSLHKLSADGTMTHHAALLQPGEPSNERIVQQMISDMDGVPGGTRIVRYK
ncbi:MAG: DUF2779 domain-containing protein [Candidatus Peribacteria bacterium]|nr:MAG: DUF2779 domain-containing protein [Candidatus Peribacteria bacterium]